MQQVTREKIEYRKQDAESTDYSTADDEYLETKSSGMIEKVLIGKEKLPEGSELRPQWKNRESTAKKMHSRIQSL